MQFTIQVIAIQEISHLMYIRWDFQDIRPVFLDIRMNNKMSHVDHVNSVV